MPLNSRRKHFENIHANIEIEIASRLATRRKTLHLKCPSSSLKQYEWICKSRLKEPLQL